MALFKNILSEDPVVFGAKQSNPTQTHYSHRQPLYPLPPMALLSHWTPSCTILTTKARCATIPPQWPGALATTHTLCPILTTQWLGSRPTR